MRGLTFIALFVCFVAVVSGKPETYTDQFDNVDVDEILNSKRLLSNYTNCLKTGKKCTPDGQKLRELLPDALKTKCSKCTDVQMRQSRKVLHFLIKNEYQTFRDLEDLFDPEHKYRVDYADDLKKEGIDIPPL